MISVQSVSLALDFVIRHVDPKQWRERVVCVHAGNRPVVEGDSARFTERALLTRRARFSMRVGRIIYQTSAGDGSERFDTRSFSIHTKLETALFSQERVEGVDPDDEKNSIEDVLLGVLHTVVPGVHREQPQHTRNRG